MTDDSPQLSFNILIILTFHAMRGEIMSCSTNPRMRFSEDIDCAEYFINLLETPSNIQL